MSDTPADNSRNAVTVTAVPAEAVDGAPPPPVAAPLTNSACAAPVRSRELGAVRLICEIGRGGMGVVWRGRHQVLGRDVAVKFLQHALAGAADPAFERLLAEARAAATVRHPNLVPVYHADIADGCPYLVMEYVHGLTLGRLVTGAGAMPPGVALAVLTDAAAAVEALHDQAIIHRDLKPGNVLLDVQGHVYVADFGLALEHKRGMAQSGAAPAGTPLYMAPEAFDGHFSPRSDVYALGVMAFELLTGKPPFTASSPAETRRCHASEPFPIEQLRTAGVPNELVELIGRATNKAPVFRYKSARELCRGLASVGAAGLAQERTELRRLVIRVAASRPGDGGDGSSRASGDGGTTTQVAGNGAATAPPAPWDDVLSRVAGRFRESRKAAAASAPRRAKAEELAPLVLPLPSPGPVTPLPPPSPPEQAGASLTGKDSDSE